MSTGRCLSIMGKQATRKQASESRRKELYDLYLRRTDRINDWHGRWHRIAIAAM